MLDPTQGSSAATRGLHLLGLCSFAIAQPLFDLIANHAAFLVVRKVSPPEILALAVILLLVPTLVLFAVELASGLVSRRLAITIHHAIVALLVAVTALPLLKKLGLVAPTPILILAVIIGLGAAVAYSRLAPVRSAVSVLGAASFLFAGFFLANESISRLVLHDGTSEIEVAGIESETPIVILILDELPLSSLLDASGSIDSSRYPSFASLAMQSTWFPNTTSVDWRTLQVIPAMLTGSYPGASKRLPVAYDHPRNLFAILEDHYVMNVVETHTLLYEREATDRDPPLERAKAFYSDLYYVYLHVILPPALAERQPSVTKTWKNFGRPLAGNDRGGAGMVGRPGHFRRFLESIRATERPTLHFLHLMLPHSPWHYLPSGNAYTPFQVDGFFLESWAAEPWWGLASYQRHLLQIQFVDSLLGELVDHLRRIGLWDSSLVLVTADHGVTFWPDQDFRDVGGATHPEDILNVPLFIKQPGQRLGRKDPRLIETVDILPTLLDALDIDLPWPVDGCSAYGEGCEEREEITAFTRTAFTARTNRRLTFPVDVLTRRDTLDRKIEWFGDGKDTRGTGATLHRFGPHASLVGLRVGDLPVGPSTVGEVRIERVRGSKSLDGSDRAVPARVAATLHLDGGEPASTPHVAIAISGTIQTVVPAPRDGLDELRKKGYLTGEFAGLRVSAMLPEAAVRRGARPQFFLVTVPIEGETGLAPLRVVEAER